MNGEPAPARYAALHAGPEIGDPDMGVAAANVGDAALFEHLPVERR
jgi:hypothetical protein